MGIGIAMYGYIVIQSGQTHVDDSSIMTTKTGTLFVRILLLHPVQEYTPTCKFRCTLLASVRSEALVKKLRCHGCFHDKPGGGFTSNDNLFETGYKL